MKLVRLPVEDRPEEQLGRIGSRRLRRAGKIPAVMYGENGLRHLTIEKPVWNRIWKQIAGGTALLELDFSDGEERPEGASEEEGKTVFSIIKEYQRDPLTESFEHIDLLEVVRGKDMEATIPVRTHGEAFGVRNQAGIIEVNLHEIEVRCRPRNLPEVIEVDVTELHVGQSYHVSELTAPEGVTFLSDGDLVVVTCSGAQKEEAGAGAGEEEEEAAEANA